MAQPIATPLMYSIKETLTREAMSFLGRMYFTMKEDEFLDAYIEPEHLSLLREVEALTGGTEKPDFSTNHPLPNTSTDYTLSVRFVSGGAPVLMPSYARSGMRAGANPETRRRLDEWVTSRARVGSAFAVVRSALDGLNATCGNAAAMTLLLPCLPALIARAEDRPATQKLAARLLTAKSFGYMPSVPRHTKELLSESSVLISTILAANSGGKSNPPPANAAVVLSSELYSSTSSPTNNFGGDLGGWNYRSYA